jgi:5'-3' exonuclease
MILNLIIDGNYILSRLVYTLDKNNLLYGALYNSLINSISNYKKIYPFSNVYLVSDSKEKSWRKDKMGEYKSKRKKDSNIDWKFVYGTYEEFKKDVTGVRVLEYPTIEGDDWISFLVEMENERGRSNMIISNDYDIKQLLRYNMDPLWINFMTNEMLNKQKVFMPINYQIFLDSVKMIPNDDIFELNDNAEFIKLLSGLVEKYEIIEIDSVESLLIKTVMGDPSDNIESVFKTENGGITRGIAIKGATNIIKKYQDDFGQLDLDDPDLYDNISDIICEKKNVPKSTIPKISKRIVENLSLIDLRIKTLPKDIVNKMEGVYRGE